MPNIQPFDAGNLALRPTETGVEARAGTARRVGTFYNQQAGAEEMLARETERLGAETARVGSETAALGSFKGQELARTGRVIGTSIAAAGDAAVSYLDHQQISHGAAGYSNLLMSSTQEWNDLAKNSDPNDPTIAQKFMDGLEGKLTAFKEDGFYTENAQKWAEAHVDALRQHFAEKTIADMSARAGQAVKVNNQQSLNTLSNTAYSDPSSLDFTLASYKSTLEGVLSSSPNLTGTQAGAVRSELLQKGAESIVKSAAIGYIEKNAALPPWINDPKYAPFVNGAELKQFEKAAQAQAKVNAYYDRQTTLAKKQLADQQVHAGSTKALNDNVTFDPQSGKPVVNPKFFKDALQIARDNPDAPSAAATVRTMVDWGESQQNKEHKAVDDPTVLKDLTDRMFDPVNPTTRLDLMKASAAGKLSDHSFQANERLVTELEQSPLKGPIWHDTVNAVKAELILSGVGLPGKDIAGEANYAKWAQTFIPQYLAKSRNNTLPSNALDVKDPNSMISQSMAQFKRSVQDRVKDYLSVLGGANPQLPSAPARMIGDVPVPAALGGVAALQYNPKTKQWRDQTSGIIYDSAGQPVTR